MEKSGAKWEDVRELLLVIEILSPITARLDRAVRLVHFRLMPVTRCGVV